ncbi:hypothetical protein [Mesorhizobium sp. M8A.F.Ca.ET.057.01.1.1]|uniref:hypothetical protein n=1 Tax=Mesorhizobium sp. M8A.F.Ca.ET.057.01.1.1 TaxID=2493679 RepID=UPI001FDF8156|nr:hypothetical protein [Mesorhizobium sp. M8A.F.Ca.ET.057.01.1.1]
MALNGCEKLWPLPVAQGEHSSKLEAWIDATLDAMQIARGFEPFDRAAKALVRCRHRPFLSIVRQSLVSLPVERDMLKTGQ